MKSNTRLTCQSFKLLRITLVLCCGDFYKTRKQSKLHSLSYLAPSNLFPSSETSKTGPKKFHTDDEHAGPAGAQIAPIKPADFPFNMADAGNIHVFEIMT